MLRHFAANSQLRSGQIRITWEWMSADPQRPAWQLVRRPHNAAATPAGGSIAFSMTRLFETETTVWAQVAQLVYAISNTGSGYPMPQLETALYFDATDDLRQLDLRYYDAATDANITTRFTGVIVLNRSTGSDATWAEIETVTIDVDGGPVGQLVIMRQHTDGITADQVEWQPAGDPPVALPFDALVVQQTSASANAGLDSILATAQTTYRTGGTFEDALAPDLDTFAPLRQVQVEDRFDGNTGDWLRRTTVTENNLAPGIQYAYRLFNADVTDPLWVTSAMAAQNYGFADHLYRLLPAVHRRYDEPTPQAVRAQQGQLRRFLSVFGIALDFLRSNATGLGQRHDLDTVRADMLPYIAQWIGWDIDRTLSLEAQRTNVRYAAETYRTVGTLPNIQSLVTRVTEWPCETKEFVHNVFQTNAPEAITLWELWTMTNDGAGWSDPAPLSTTDGFDGSPTLAHTANGDTWGFWHRGRRSVVLQRPGDAEPLAAATGASDEEVLATDAEPAALFADGAVWLFWTSDRDNGRNIWARRYVGTPPTLPSEDPVQLTDHPADDSAPFVVEAADGTLHLFWQSMRRGVKDIWTRQFDGVSWGQLARLTDGASHESEPTAAVDGSGRIWLFYVMDRGNQRGIWSRVLDAGVWSAPQAVISTADRNEAPAAIFWDGALHLCWQSRQDDIWHIMLSRYDEMTTTWGVPQTLTTETRADKEPALIVEGSTLRLVWRSQRRGRQYQSRTLDVQDDDVLAAMGQLNDRTHYLFDTSRTNNDWYARDVVGLYVTPDTDDVAEITRKIERARDFVEPFRPVHVRFVWILNAVRPSVVNEFINTGIFISDADWSETVS